MRQHIGRWFGWLAMARPGARAMRLGRRSRPYPHSTCANISGALCSAGSSALGKAQPPPQLLRKVRTGPVETVPGMPPVPDPNNLYSATASGRFAAAVAGTPARIYVPNRRSNNVYVIDPPPLLVMDRFPVGFSPQHVVPSWDLKTLWVANNGSRRTSGSLTPIDPKTGKPGQPSRSTTPTTSILRPTAIRRSSSPSGANGSTFAIPIRWRLQQSIAAPGLLRHQPRRFLDRWSLRDLHLRVPRRRFGQDRSRQSSGAGLSEAVEEGHATGHSDFARRRDLLCRRHACRWRLPG